MTRLEQFFYDNASYAYDPLTGDDRNHVERAKELANAARQALENAWLYEWEEEEQDEWYCQLWQGDRLLGSLSGIDTPTAEYRRVVEAELAFNALAEVAQ